MKYKYLISYMFTSNVYIKDASYPQRGNGRMLLSSSFKIRTEKDINETEKNLLKILDEEIDNLQSVNLCSFNLLEEE